MTQTAAEADILLPATSCAEHEGVYSAMTVVSNVSIKRLSQLAMSG